MPITILEELYDDECWQRAFMCVNKISIPLSNETALAFAIDEIISIIAISNGKTDGEPWIGLFELPAGRFGYMEAKFREVLYGVEGSATQTIAFNKDLLIRFGIPDGARLRLGITLADLGADTGKMANQ